MTGRCVVTVFPDVKAVLMWCRCIVVPTGPHVQFLPWQNSRSFVLHQFQELVNLRMVSLKDGYLDMRRWDQLKQGKILFITVLRNRMYTHGSRIWFQVAKRMQSSSFLIWNGCLDSTVCAIKTWWRRKRQIYLFTRDPRRHTDNLLRVELSYGHVTILWM